MISKIVYNFKKQILGWKTGSDGYFQYEILYINRSITKNFLFKILLETINSSRKNPEEVEHDQQSNQQHQKPKLGPKIRSQDYLVSPLYINWSIIKTFLIKILLEMINSSRKTPRKSNKKGKTNYNIKKPKFGEVLVRWPNNQNFRFFIFYRRWKRYTSNIFQVSYRPQKATFSIKISAKSEYLQKRNLESKFEKNEPFWKFWLSARKCPISLKFLQYVVLIRKYLQ